MFNTLSGVRFLFINLSQLQIFFALDKHTFDTLKITIRRSGVAVTLFALKCTDIIEAV